MRTIELYARHAGGGSNPVIWLIPLDRVVWVRWADGITTIRTADGVVLENDDSDARYYADVQEAFSRDKGVYRVGGEWRYWYEEGK